MVDLFPVGKSKIVEEILQVLAFQHTSVSQLDFPTLSQISEMQKVKGFYYYFKSGH